MKNIYECAKQWCATKCLRKKGHEVETHKFSSEENVPNAALINESHHDSRLEKGIYSSILFSLKKLSL